jgi:hypothetical protein
MKKWEIVHMEVLPLVRNLQYVVKSIVYKRVYTLTENGNTFVAEVNGMVNLPEPTGRDFIQYDYLTEEMVGGWIESLVDVQQVDMMVEERMQITKNPPLTSLPLPWQK